MTRPDLDALRTSLRALLSYVDDGALLMRTAFPKSRNGRHIDADEASANIEYNECIREVISTARAKVKP